jgi:hypothetical protein
VIVTGAAEQVAASAHVPAIPRSTRIACLIIPPTIHAKVGVISCSGGSAPRLGGSEKRD